MYGMMSMILKYSSLIVPYTAERNYNVLSKLSIVEVAISILLLHRVINYRNASIYCYTPIWYPVYRNR